MFRRNGVLCCSRPHIVSIPVHFNLSWTFGITIKGAILFIQVSLKFNNHILCQTFYHIFSWCNVFIRPYAHGSTINNNLPNIFKGIDLWHNADIATLIQLKGTLIFIFIIFVSIFIIKMHLRQNSTVILNLKSKLLKFHNLLELFPIVRSLVGCLTAKRNIERSVGTVGESIITYGDRLTTSNRHRSKSSAITESHRADIYYTTRYFYTPKALATNKSIITNSCYTIWNNCPTATMYYCVCSCLNNCITIIA